MEIILLENIRNLGRLGQIARVANGYARNYLIPYGKALPATKQNKEFFEHQKQVLEKQAAEKLAHAQKRAEAFENLTLKVEVQASLEGKLFGSIKLSDVLDLIAARGLDVQKNEVRLDKTIREVGQYQVELHLHPEVVLSLPLMVAAQQSQ